MINDQTKTDINVFLTEQFLGRCWHKIADRYGQNFCQKCKQHHDSNLDLFTPEGFFILWEKAQKEEWWVLLCDQVYDTAIHADYRGSWMEVMVNPRTFPTLLATYLGWKE